jgi:ribosome recycling factor
LNWIFIEGEAAKDDIMSDILVEMTDKMEKSLDSFKKELSKVRTGRASIAILDGIHVDAYGSAMPLAQVGSLTIPESRLIVIQPWDPQLLSAIEKAILKSDIGLNPISDGKVIRLNIPQLTQERRKELVKSVKKVAEEFRVAIRNLRRDALETLKKKKKDKEISEDDLFKFQEEAQSKTDAFVKKIDDATIAKEKEVMEV